MGAVVRSEAEIRESLEKDILPMVENDRWTAAWAEALEWVLS